MKKLLTLLVLLCAIFPTVWAESYFIKNESTSKYLGIDTNLSIVDEENAKECTFTSVSNAFKIGIDNGYIHIGSSGRYSKGDANDVFIYKVNGNVATKVTDLGSIESEQEYLFVAVKDSKNYAVKAENYSSNSGRRLVGTEVTISDDKINSFTDYEKWKIISVNNVENVYLKSDETFLGFDNTDINMLSTPYAMYIENMSPYQYKIKSNETRTRGINSASNGYLSKVDNNETNIRPFRFYKVTSNNGTQLQATLADKVEGGKSTKYVLVVSSASTNKYHVVYGARTSQSDKQRIDVLKTNYASWPETITINSEDHVNSTDATVNFNKVQWEVINSSAPVEDKHVYTIKTNHDQGGVVIGGVQYTILNNNTSEITEAEADAAVAIHVSFFTAIVDVNHNDHTIKVTYSEMEKTQNSFEAEGIFSLGTNYINGSNGGIPKVYMAYFNSTDNSDKRIMIESSLTNVSAPVSSTAYLFKLTKTGEINEFQEEKYPVYYIQPYDDPEMYVAHVDPSTLTSTSQNSGIISQANCIFYTSDRTRAKWILYSPTVLEENANNVKAYHILSAESISDPSNTVSWANGDVRFSWNNKGEQGYVGSWDRGENEGVYNAGGSNWAICHVPAIWQGENGNFGTANFAYPTNLPDNVKAYTLTGNADGRLSFSKEYSAGEVLPAETPVLLYTEDEINYGECVYYRFEQATTDGIVPSSNLFGGTLAAKTFEDDVYVLDADAYNNNVFMRSQNRRVNANKAYIPASIVAPVQNFVIDITEEGTTDIKPQYKGNNMKPLIYNLQGIRIHKIQKGINIIDGEKIIR